MVLIRCIVRKHVGEKNFIFLPTTIRSGRLAGHVAMMVDTGSPLTVIAPRDLLRFRISVKKLSKTPGDTVQLAGFKFKRLPIGDIRVTVRTERDSPINLTTSCYNYIAPTKTDKKTMKAVQNIPSILGNDFMEEQNVSLFYDPKSKKAHLDFKDIPDPDS